MTQVTLHDASGEDAKVIEGKLQTKSIVETQLESISASNGQAYSYTSTYSATSGQEIMTIKNDIKQHMHIDQVWVSGAAAAIFSIGHVTSGTPGGTTITGNPLNHDLSEVADTTAFGNAEVTGTVVVADEAWLLAPAGQTVPFDLEGAWIFAKDDVFGIRVDTSTVVHVTVILHMDD